MSKSCMSSFLYVETWIMCFFFFSSRRRHTRLQGDWSSDVCSSDLTWTLSKRLILQPGVRTDWDRVTQSAISEPRLSGSVLPFGSDRAKVSLGWGIRSEERRVGKECRSRWSPYH